jgi:hypothetical protein
MFSSINLSDVLCGSTPIGHFGMVLSAHNVRGSLDGILRMTPASLCMAIPLTKEADYSTKDDYLSDVTTKARPSKIVGARSVIEA